MSSDNFFSENGQVHQDMLLDVLLYKLVDMQENMNTNSETPVQMNLPTLQVQTQNVQPANASQNPSNHPTIMKSTVSVSQPQMQQVFSNQTMLTKPGYSSTVPLASTSQVSNGDQLKQIVSQPQIVTTQSSGQTYGSFHALPQGLTWASPANTSQPSATFPYFNPVNVRNQQPSSYVMGMERIIQQPPTQGFLPAPAGTASTPTAVYTTAIPQGQTQMYRRGNRLLHSIISNPKFQAVQPTLNDMGQSLSNQIMSVSSLSNDLIMMQNNLDTVEDSHLTGSQTGSTVPEAAGQSSRTSSTSVQTTLPCLQSLSDDLAQLMVDDSYHDIEFQCGAGQSTKAHKSIVCKRSPVIASMLARNTGVLAISDMEPDIFTQFMRYIYCGQLEELTYDAALRLYEAGHRYQVLGLAKRCSEFLVGQLSVDNACEVLLAADARNDRKCMEKVIDYMVESRVPFVSEKWSAFCDEHSKLAIKVLTRAFAKNADIRCK